MDYSGLKAIITAGDGRDSQRLDYADPSGRHRSNTCFIPVNGKTSLERIVSELDSLGIRDRHITTRSDLAERASEIDPDAAVYPCDADSFIDTVFFIRENIPLLEEEYVLLIFGDTPFTTRRAIADFLDKCTGGKDAYHAIVPKESLDFFDSVFPRRRYVPAKEMDFRVSNLTYVRPGSLDYSFLQSAADIKAQKNIANRIRGIYEVFNIGKGEIVRPFLNLILAYEAEKYSRNFIARMLRQNVPLEKVEKACGAFFKGKIGLVPSPYAEITFDIDDDPKELGWIVDKEKEIIELIRIEHQIIDLVGDAMERVDRIAGAGYRDHPVLKKLMGDYSNAARFLVNVGFLRPKKRFSDRFSGVITQYTK